MYKKQNCSKKKKFLEEIQNVICICFLFLTGTGNAYAFIRYENLDMAHRAKVELSGQYIGKFQCKIGYGKVNATTKVWVGQLGSWCSRDLLWKEFDRFGAIKDIEYRTGDTQVTIIFSEKYD